MCHSRLPHARYCSLEEEKERIEKERKREREKERKREREKERKREREKERKREREKKRKREREKERKREREKERKREREKERKREREKERKRERVSSSARGVPRITFFSDMNLAGFAGLITRRELIGVAGVNSKARASAANLRSALEKERTNKPYLSEDSCQVNRNLFPTMEGES